MEVSIISEDKVHKIKISGCDRGFWTIISEDKVPVTFETIASNIANLLSKVVI